MAQAWLKAVDEVADFPPEIRDRPQVVQVDSDITPMLEIAVAGKNTPLDRLKRVTDVISVARRGDLAVRPVAWQKHPLDARRQ